MTVNGFAVPAVRSSYSFGPDVLYQFKIDTTGDAKEDLVIQVTFDGFESERDRALPGAGRRTVLHRRRAGQADERRAQSATCSAVGPDVSGCTNTVLNSDGIRAWAGLADDPFVVDIGQLNRILGNAQDVFRDVDTTRARPAPRPPRAAGRHQRGGRLRRIQHLGGHRRGPDLDAHAGGADADRSDPASTASRPS